MEEKEMEMVGLRKKVEEVEGKEVVKMLERNCN